MNNLLLKSLTICFVFSLAGCDKNKDADTMSREETTTPHALEAEPVEMDHSREAQLHDDLQHGSSAPVMNESDETGLTNDNTQTNLSSRTPSN
ncbi:hypothetical protein [Acinetobacter sp. NIPH 298]|uniref:hypothetical protein n=1 Tax=Acinetobacter sp. NIPH 298 TaxID=1217692 RepID=UPI0002D09BFD|nr:hypothetical protein [Acinetobacter sp. NIPH 298]ENW95842.1 hypothetical protein F903_01605 [Acinetobacter sp. NIPH 298]